MMIILLISAGALVLVTGGCVIAGTMQAPDPRSRAGRIAARERAKAHRRAQRIANPRPWEAPEQAN